MLMPAGRQDPAGQLPIRSSCISPFSIVALEPHASRNFAFANTTFIIFGNMADHSDVDVNNASRTALRAQPDFRRVDNIYTGIKAALSNIPADGEWGHLQEARQQNDALLGPFLEDYKAAVEEDLDQYAINRERNEWLTDGALNKLLLRKSTLVALSKILPYDCFVVVVCFL